MKIVFTIISLLLFITGCAIKHTGATEGFVQVEGGRIWYKKEGLTNETPLLIIHGGPGSRSCDGIPVYTALGNERPIIFYDQLGSGNSDRPTDTTLWNLPRFVDEVTSLRKELGLKELHILGSSWGAAVAIEYLLSQKPEGVKSVIFAGPLLSSTRWMEDAKILLAQLPKNLQDTINKYEELEQYSAPSYLAATDSFYVRHLSRKWGTITAPATCDGVASFNSQVYQYMWGPTEFKATGTLKHFDRTDRLHELELPVLFVTGQYDEARPETMYEFQKQVKNAKVEIIENSGHMKTIDNPHQYINVIRSFLASQE
jgi:proline iminopeptidase